MKRGNDNKSISLRGQNRQSQKAKTNILESTGKTIWATIQIFAKSYVHYGKMMKQKNEEKKSEIMLIHILVSR